jgi:hypothetical protein
MGDRLELLDQMLVDLNRSFGADEDISVITNAVHLVRNRLGSNLLTEKVAQLAKNGDLDGALKTMLEFPADLKISKVPNILKLLYDDEKYLINAIRFVEKLGVGPLQEACMYVALYEDVRLKGHTEMLEVLLLQRNMRRVVTDGDSEVLKQLDDNRLRIVDRIVNRVKAKDYELTCKIVKTLGQDILIEQIASIVKKVHVTGSLEETLLLLNFSQGLLPETLCQCALIQALFEMLKSKVLLQSDHGMHLWTHIKAHSNNGAVQEKCLTVCNELAQNKEVYFEIYRGYLTSPDTNKIKMVHQDNCQLNWIVTDFVHFFYDGDLEKVHELLSAAKNVSKYTTRIQILQSLYEKMSLFNQLGTFEAFKLFTLVKHSSSNSMDASTKNKFIELQAKAPPCLKTLLWPTAEFRLINKFLNTPLHSNNTKVFCGPPAAISDALLWSAQVNPSNSLITLKIQGNKRAYSSKLNGRTGKSPARLSSNGTEWKIKPVDDNHVKLYSDSKFFF